MTGNMVSHIVVDIVVKTPFGARLRVDAGDSGLSRTSYKGSRSPSDGVCGLGNGVIPGGVQNAVYEL